MGAWVTNAEQRLGRDEIAQLLAQHGKPRWWSNGPGDTYAPHAHAYHKVLYCVTGTIIFHVDGEDHMLSSGDRLDVEADTEHAATVGPEGVQCGEVAVEE